MVRRSLGDEIRRLGILGSPFCDKIKSIHSGIQNISFNGSLQEKINDSPDSTEVREGREVSLEKAQETHCSELQPNEPKNIPLRAQKTLQSLGTMFISFAKTISFLSFYRSHSNPRLKVYLQKVYIINYILALQIKVYNLILSI